jgi:uncharacterized protein YegL
MSEALRESAVQEQTHVQGQLVMPFYVICDVSGSMSGDIAALQAGLEQLKADIMKDPVVDDLTMLSVIAFGTDAKTVVALAPPSEVVIPQLQLMGGTDFGAAFREYHRAFEEDRARLKAEGKKVYRPCVFFLTDGEPWDKDYVQTFSSLLAYDPATNQGNRAFPYVVTFGFRDAPEDVIRGLAYPDFGSTKGKWFLARSSNISELLRSMTKAIGNTVVSSGLSASAGVPQIVPPTVSPQAGMQFGDAGDLV